MIVWCMKLKLKMFMKTLVRIKKCLNLVIIKMKEETKVVAIKEFVGLKPKMYSFMVDDNSEHKKAKIVSKMLLRKELIVNTTMFC